MKLKLNMAYINYYQSCLIIFLQNHHGSVLQRDLDEADHLQSQAFHFVFSLSLSYSRYHLVFGD